MSPTDVAPSAILVVAFGTTYPETRRLTIDACEQRIAAAFPECETRRAFTSTIVRRILARRGEEVQDVPSALARLREEGFRRIVVQPLHIIPGEEFHRKILFEVASYRNQFAGLAVGRPILARNEDYSVLALALKEQLPATVSAGSGEAVVLMGHGSAHPANAAYSQLQLLCEDAGLPVYVGTVEGYPELEQVMTRLRRDRVRRVTLMPLMVVAGDHAVNDMAGDDPDSWNSRLRAEGFEVDCYVHGLGENAAFQEIYVSHVLDALQADSEVDEPG